MRVPRSIAGIAAASAAVAAVVAACSDSAVFGPVASGGGKGDGGAGLSSGGTSIGGATATTAAGGSPSGACEMDCSSIVTPPCTEAICDRSSGSCTVVDSAQGTPCDDGAFCSQGDVCNGSGECLGGPPNDCGIVPPQCNVVQCNESSDSCSTVPGPNGTACTTTNLCLLNAHCVAGSCSGGQLKDCFFFPVPNECHSSLCNPQTGQCEAQPDPSKQGQPCTDPSTPCLVGKTCNSTGGCLGGQPKDCSQLDSMCQVGQCNPNDGQCFAQPVLGPCDDQNACTTGESCQGGVCSGGAPITQCANGDGCCPVGCDETSDTDCQQVVYSHAFTAGTLPTSSPQCVDWAGFVAQLTGSFSAVIIRGSNDPIGVTCNVPSLATQLCNALHTKTTLVGVSCNGRIWNVGECSAEQGQQYEINSRTVSGSCSCDNGYTVRPCIGNDNWGGINGPTCAAQSQTMEVVCVK